MSRTPWRVAFSGVIAASLLAITPAVSTAQSSLLGSSQAASDSDSPGTDETGEGTNTSSDINALLNDLIAGSSQATSSTSLSVDLGLSSMGLLSSEMSFEGPLLSSEDGYPLPTDPSISKVEVREITVDHRADRLERWQVASPSMKRVVDVQILRAADTSAPAPMIYLLDGIGGSRNSSGWINGGEAPRVFADENVTAVMPLGAAASMYSDWEQEDPALGTIMWETFITEELAPLLEDRPELNFNGHRAVGGLSMGATGAVHLANSNPEFFDGVIGISGCYSTMDLLGRTTAQLIVGSRGGDVENMWGPFGSETWHEHDVVADPSGLGEMAVYLSAAPGRAGEVDHGVYEGDPFYNMIAGVVLEHGSYDCTRNLAGAMKDASMDHQVVNYQDTGLHNWPNYNSQLQPGWDEIKKELY